MGETTYQLVQDFFHQQYDMFLVLKSRTKDGTNQNLPDKRVFEKTAAICHLSQSLRVHRCRTRVCSPENLWKRSFETTSTASLWIHEWMQPQLPSSKIDSFSVKGNVVFAKLAARATWKKMCISNTATHISSGFFTRFLGILPFWILCTWQNHGHASTSSN